MLITLDLDALTARGKITQAEADRLLELRLPDRRIGLFVNTGLIFGAMAVAAGVIALVPSPTTGLMLALLALGGAIGLRVSAGPNWTVLSQALAIMAALGLSGWIAGEYWESEYAFWPPFAIFAITTAVAAGFRNSFLSAMAVLAFGALLGSGTVYWHAAYGLFVREAFITIIAFSVLAGGLYSARDRIGSAWQSVTTIAARTAVIMVNFGFWIGSLWGDRVGELWATANKDWDATNTWRQTAFELPEELFTLGWAGALIACMIFARRGSFLSISALVFLCIHFYTQYFEMFGAEPEALLVGGLIAVGLATWGGRRLAQSRS
ncbi:MAG: hypothetical protein AAFX02_03470 [Pseudomonadota bacterium]